MQRTWRIISLMAVLLCGLTACLKWPNPEGSSKQLWRSEPDPSNTRQYLPRFRVCQQGGTIIGRPENRGVRRVLELFSTMRRETRNCTTHALKYPSPARLLAYLTT